MYKRQLVTFAERDGRRLIAVVMKSPKANDKYTDTAALFDYGFGGFSTYRADAAGLIRGIPRSLLRGDLLRADITAAEDFTALIPNEAAAGDVHAVYYLPEELEEEMCIRDRLRSISFAISKSAPELLIFESENGKSVYGRAGLARRQSS